MINGAKKRKNVGTKKKKKSTGGLSRTKIHFTL